MFVVITKDAVKVVLVMIVYLIQTAAVIMNIVVITHAKTGIVVLLFGLLSSLY